MSQISILCLAIRLEIFDVGSKNADFLVEIAGKIEIVEFSQSKLVIVVVQ